MNIQQLDSLVDIAIDDPLVNAILTSILSKTKWWSSANSLTNDSQDFGCELFDEYRYTSADLEKIRGFCLSSLQWMLDDGLISELLISARREVEVYIILIQYDKNTLKVPIDV